MHYSITNVFSRLTFHKKTKITETDSQLAQQLQAHDDIQADGN